MGLYGTSKSKVFQGLVTKCSERLEIWFLSPPSFPTSRLTQNNSDTPETVALAASENHRPDSDTTISCRSLPAEAAPFPWAMVISWGSQAVPNVVDEVGRLVCGHVRGILLGTDRIYWGILGLEIHTSGPLGLPYLQSSSRFVPTQTLLW